MLRCSGKKDKQRATHRQELYDCHYRLLKLDPQTQSRFGVGTETGAAAWASSRPQRGTGGGPHAPAKGLRLLVKRPVSTGVTRKVRQIAAALICFCEVRNADETKNRLSTCPHFSGAAGRQLLSFLLMYVSPGDPVRAMYAVSGSIPSEEVLEQTREELGLNDPFFIQYGNWISNCLRGDFGTSYSKGEAVATL